MVIYPGLHLTGYGVSKLQNCRYQDEIRRGFVLRVFFCFSMQQTAQEAAAFFWFFLSHPYRMMYQLLVRYKNYKREGKKKSVRSRGLTA